jgi:uncharacterized protein (UPF0333 family)
MRRLLWLVLVVTLTGIGMFVSAIVYANRVANSAKNDANRAIRESEKTQCIVYNIIHKAQKEAPPTTPSGKEFAEAVEQIRARFKCEEKDK